MNIAITGASGFVGKNLIPYLQQLNHNVLPLSRSDKFTYSNIDSNLLDSNNINVIIHLAGKAHDLKHTTNSQDYFEANTDLTISLFNAFLISNSSIFIYLSSIKSVADSGDQPITEDVSASPVTAYGLSKLKAENYLQSITLPSSKKVFILRPCMIHGPANKGNLNLLYRLVSLKIPWPLGAFENRRSFCSIDNLLFIINELLENKDIMSGVYNVADDEALSTNSIIRLIAKSQNRKVTILNLPKRGIKLMARIGDFLKLPLNSERLQKLTDSYVLSNEKIKIAIGKPLPITSEEGLLKTFNSFK